MYFSAGLRLKSKNTQSFIYREDCSSPSRESPGGWSGLECIYWTVEINAGLHLEERYWQYKNTQFKAATLCLGFGDNSQLTSALPWWCTHSSPHAEAGVERYWWPNSEFIELPLDPADRKAGQGGRGRGQRALWPSTVQARAVTCAWRCPSLGLHLVIQAASEIVVKMGLYAFLWIPGICI